LAAAGHDQRRRSESAAVAAIVLDLGDAPWAGVPCWTRAQQWATFSVSVAYAARYDTHVRPVMPGNPVSLNAVRAVAQVRATYADYGTGRNSRPSNERLAADTGLSVRTVQRADAALRLLGIATEVLRGRQRTRAERFASWRVGDRYRGWASVWALHDNAELTRLAYRLSPHPRSGPVREKTSPGSVVATGPGALAGRRQGGAARRRAPDVGGAGLAAAWRTDPGCPPWVQRHSPAAWAALLAAPAAHGWSPRDLNALIGDWAAVNSRHLPDRPHKPIGLLGAMLAWHGRDRLDERPAALDEAREAAEATAHQTHLAAQRAAAAEHHRARQAGRGALASAGHTAARAIVAEAARRAAHNRTHAAAEDAAQHAAAVAAARSHPRH
jgi:hypothetical protein